MPDHPVNQFAWSEQESLTEIARLQQRMVDIETDGATLHTDGLNIFCLIAAVQLACRHPEWQDGFTRIAAESTARSLQCLLTHYELNRLHLIIEAGWNPDYDVVRK